MAVVFGTGEAGRTVMKSFNLPETERVEVEDLAEKVIGMLKESGVDGELLLAALAEAGLRVADEAETNTPNAVAS